jgi:hypothetical protein
MERKSVGTVRKLTDKVLRGIKSYLITIKS